MLSGETWGLHVAYTILLDIVHVVKSTLWYLETLLTVSRIAVDEIEQTKHIHKTEDWVTRTPLKPGGALRCSGRISSSCSASGTRRVNLVTNPVISHELGKDQKVFTTSGTYLSSFIFHNSHATLELPSYISNCFLEVCLIVWCCLTPLSTIFKLYRVSQFCWWRKPEYPEKATNTLLIWLLSVAYRWRQMELLFRCWIKVDYCFTIMCYDGLLYYTI